MQNLLQIDTDKKTPKYIQIVNAINNAIRQGKLKKGDPIFSFVKEGTVWRHPFKNKR